MTALPEAVEGEVIEEHALAVVDEGLVGAGTFALAAMSPEDFQRRLDAMVEHRKRVTAIQRALMVKDVHYGVIPGTDKPSLLQPGAEVLCDIYRLRADFAPLRTIGDGIAAPHLSYLTRCDLHLGSLNGPVVASAYGAANSWEKRYRYRNAERACPNCGKTTVIKGKEEYGGGWLCWAKKGGCNSKWTDNDPAIADQVVGQMDNPDPFDLDVVLDAMAAKRAFVHATRRGCAVSDLFTSDVEDLPGFGGDEPPAKPAEPRATDPGGLIGMGAIQGTQDFELRQRPEGGYTLPFRVKEGRSSVICMAAGPMAISLHALRDAIIGKRITVWGTYRPEKFRKGDTDVNYEVLHVERVKGEDFDVPAQIAVGQEPMFDEAEEAAIAAAVDAAPAGTAA